MHRSWVFAAAAFLTGCTMIPRYERPPLPTENAYPGANGGSGKEAPADLAADEIGWREFFDDPRLQRILELTLNNNRDLRVAALRAESARAQYRIQRAALFPNIDLIGSDYETRSAAQGSSVTPVATGTQSGTGTTGGTGTGTGTTGGSTGGTGATGGSGGVSNVSSVGGVGRNFTQYSVSLGTASYELDLFGRIRSLKAAALNDYFASEESRRSTQISLIAQVAAQYLDERAVDAQLQIARQTLESVSKGYNLTRQSFDNGIISALDLSSNDAQVQTARANVADLELQAARVHNAFLPLVGAPLPADLPPPQPLTSTHLLADIAPGLPSDLLQRRPDILSAEYALKSSNASIGAARAAFFPSISLTASAGNSSPDLSRLLNRATDTWTFSPTITLPIFTGGSNLANLDLAKISKRIDIATYEKTIQTSFREVSDALVARTSLNTQVAAYEALVRAQQRRYDLSELRYRAGIDNYLTFLLAQQDLYSAQQSLVQARLNRLINLINLYKALGGGWKS